MEIFTNILFSVVNLQRHQSITQNISLEKKLLASLYYKFYIFLSVDISSNLSEFYFTINLCFSVKNAELL